MVVFVEMENISKTEIIAFIVCIGYSAAACQHARRFAGLYWLQRQIIGKGSGR